jgi:hypothetical protein
MDTGFAPKALKVSMNKGEPTTRIFRPSISSGVRTGRFELVSSLKPFSPHPRPITPFSSIILKSSFPGSPASTASRAL